MLESVETQLALLVDAIERHSEDVKALTSELRQTNNAVQAQHTSLALLEQLMGRVRGEIWTSDNASRIRALELQIRGLSTLVGFLVVGIAGELVKQWVTGK